jgi:hypothetical protein
MFLGKNTLETTLEANLSIICGDDYSDRIHPLSLAYTSFAVMLADQYSPLCDK